ncbi:hypothetical protein L1987_60063 [Smallanthus sonchifolius]|uniref:Uncharacterized protein n=1 Tax=Smallanthus sonchifolius TaxID=185202 RepID=A0ACB9D7L8_9ASTR|nr:hypothetical protein L1987_60063 [Smallanthus sonchifolius]
MDIEKRQMNQIGYSKKTGDSSVNVSKNVKADKVREVDNITAGLGFSNNVLINSDISQTADCKPISPVSMNCFDQIVHVAKDFIPIKFIKEGSSDIASHSVLYPANISNDEVNNILTNKGPCNMDKVAERLKNKKVEENIKAAKFKKPFKACFKCGEEGHVVKHCKQVETSSSSSKRHGSDGKGNKNCFSGSKSTRNNFLNDQKKNYSSRSLYVKPVSHNSMITSKKYSPRYSHAPIPKSPKPSKVKKTYVPKSFASKLKQNIVSNFKSDKTKICKPTQRKSF